MLQISSVCNATHTTVPCVTKLLQMADIRQTTKVHVHTHTHIHTLTRSHTHTQILQLTLSASNITHSLTHLLLVQVQQFTHLLLLLIYLCSLLLQLCLQLLIVSDKLLNACQQSQGFHSWQRLTTLNVIQLHTSTHICTSCQHF